MSSNNDILLKITNQFEEAIYAVINGVKFEDMVQVVPEEGPYNESEDIRPRRQRPVKSSFKSERENISEQLKGEIQKDQMVKVVNKLNTFGSLDDLLAL